MLITLVVSEGLPTQQRIILATSGGGRGSPDGDERRFEVITGGGRISSRSGAVAHLAAEAGKTVPAGADGPCVYQCKGTPLVHGLWFGKNNISFGL
jgi:hypothetical protein